MKYLDTNIWPTVYNLHLNLDLINDTFIGKNSIILDIKKSSNIIEFHSLRLVILNIKLDNIDIDVKTLKYDNDNELCTINLNKELDVGIHELIIQFSGKIAIGIGSGLIKGINNHKNRIIYYTRFEPNHARKCFPCWDEPNFKVKYNMSIEINDKSYSIIFNTDSNKIEDLGNNKIIYHFQKKDFQKKILKII
jgi:aminopeptidase N